MKKLLLIVFCLFGFSVLYAQDDEKGLKLNAGADIMSRYVWRGLDYGAAPSIQPLLSVTTGGLELGYWGAMSTLGTYNEVDLYAKYTIKSFSILATDYFFPVDMIPPVKPLRYFNYESETTGHLMEVALSFNGTEKLPLTLLAGTTVYGADKDTAGDNRYSTYVELGYAFKLKGQDLNFMLGFTPTEGLYGTSAGIINIGLTGKKNIKITSDFELPVKVSVVTNPQAENIHLIFGFTL